MKKSSKEKICPQCEGRMSLSATVCPFCASDQLAGSLAKSFQTPLFQNQSLEDSLTSLYTPPYEGKKPQFAKELEETFVESYEIPRDEPSIPSEEIFADLEPQTQQKGGRKELLIPLLFLMGGANLALIGIFQIFFSKNGALSLEWDAHFWFLYLLFGAPLLYFGYKKLPE